MGSKGAAGVGGAGGGGGDHDQILAAVVVALGRSSGKVANYSCEDSSGEIDTSAGEESVQNSKPPAKSHHNMFGCFAKPSSIKSATSRLPSWPKSPSHIMSRLLLSPDMSPDRILVKSVPCSPAPGDQSPARPTSRLSSSRSQFSGPLLGFKSTKAKSNKSKSKQEVEFEKELRDEPTSPKVTCMGTVKAPKKCKKSKKNKESQVCTDMNSCRPPKWKRGQTSVVSQDYSGLLMDLSRLGQRSGELRKSGEVMKPSSRRVCGKSLSNLFEQEQKHQGDDESDAVSATTTDGRKGILTDSDQNVRLVVAARSRSLLQPFSCREGLKRPEEICLWKRRCVPEPLRLDVITRNN